MAGMVRDSSLSRRPARPSHECRAAIRSSGRLDAGRSPAGEKDVRQPPPSNGDLSSAGCRPKIVHQFRTDPNSPINSGLTPTPPTLFAPCDCRGYLQPGYARAERRLRHPDVGPVQGRNPSGLRFLRRFRLARTVAGDRLANERLEGGRVKFFSFVDVDRAACVSVETRVEETGWIIQRRALGEGKLHDMLVGFASADDAVMRPHRGTGFGWFDPLPLLDDVRVCFLDERAHSAEGFPAPVPEFDDSFRYELRCRLALARVRLFHVLILEESGPMSATKLLTLLISSNPTHADRRKGTSWRMRLSRKYRPPQARIPTTNGIAARAVSAIRK